MTNKHREMHEANQRRLEAARLEQQEPATGPNLVRQHDRKAVIRTVAISRIDESDMLRLREPPYPAVDELAADISEKGQTTPLFVRPVGDRFDLIAGYRRLTALKLLRAEDALVRVYDGLSDREAYDLAVSENKERQDLSTIEKALICQRLQTNGKTLPDIAAQIGMSRTHVVRHLSLARDASPVLRTFLNHRRGVSLPVALILLAAPILGSADPTEAGACLAALPEEAETKPQRTEQHLTNYFGPPRASASPPAPKRFLRHLKNGGFSISLKAHPSRSPEELAEQAAALSSALKAIRKMQRRVRSTELAKGSAEDGVGA